jgi:hypothetical protein
MKTHVEFRSDAFPPYDDEEYEINPGRYGCHERDWKALEKAVSF